MWELIYTAAWLLSWAGLVWLACWFVWDVFVRPRRRRTGASLQADPELLRRLQEARRELGSRWVLDKSRPPVGWGIKR